MFAVVKTGGKQYLVKIGQMVDIELLEVPQGDIIDLSDVLCLSQGDQIRVGRPFVDGASVRATVVLHGRAKKVRIFKMSRRKHYRKTQGHRQYFTRIHIDAING